MDSRSTPTYCNYGHSNVFYPNSGQACLYPAGYNGSAGTDQSTSALQNGTDFSKGALSYFSLPNWPTYGLPSAPGINRNSFRGADFLGDDVQLAKAFGFPKLGILGEAMKLNFQANIYNLVNKVNADQHQHEYQQRRNHQQPSIRQGAIGLPGTRGGVADQAELLNRVGHTVPLRLNA